MIKTPRGAPKQVKKVAEEFNHFLENLNYADIGYGGFHDSLEEQNDYLDFLKTEKFGCHKQGPPHSATSHIEWFIGDSFESDYSMFYSDGQWYRRRCYDGSDSVIKGGTLEVIADLKCSITA